MYKYINHKIMEEGDLKTSPKKDVMITNVEADVYENTLPNGFDDSLLLGSFKLAGNYKALNICQNDHML